MSWFQGLSSGNGRRPCRSAPTPRVGSSFGLFGRGRGFGPAGSESSHAATLHATTNTQTHTFPRRTALVPKPLLRIAPISLLPIHGKRTEPASRSSPVAGSVRRRAPAVPASGWAYVAPRSQVWEPASRRFLGRCRARDGLGSWTSRTPAANG